MIKRVGELLDWFCDRFSVLLGAWLGSQIPQFMQQYMQRLAGRVDELSHLTAQLKYLAKQSNKTLAEYTQKFLLQEDPDFKGQGLFIQEIQARLEKLSYSLHSLLDSNFWNKPYRFFSELDKETAVATWRSFEPGISLNVEGIAYAGLGILFAYGLYRAFLRTCLHT